MSDSPESWSDRYRDKWKWDKVTWGTHAVDCYPGGCPLKVYTRNGRIVREEQSGTFKPIEAGIPDMNPMGCQKGACWSHCHYSPDRVTTPVRSQYSSGLTLLSFSDLPSFSIRA
jgi:nitrate reductase alpha subunit